MNAVAKRANVGKPTLYKWWPSKAALIMSMFHERLAGMLDAPKATTAEAALRKRVKYLIAQCNGLFGKLIADLIAEGQGDPSILSELYKSHIRPRRASIVADIERGIASGEFVVGTDSELLIDAIFAPIYVRLLLRHTALTEEYGDRLIDEALVSIRTIKWETRRRRNKQLAQGPMLAGRYRNGNWISYAPLGGSEATERHQYPESCVGAMPEVIASYALIGVDTCTEHILQRFEPQRFINGRTATRVSDLSPPHVFIPEPKDKCAQS
jgi:AcrR family transcriptional regulator